MMDLPGQKVKVIHSTSRWLSQTQTWMYNHIRHLPKEIESHIVCQRVENLDQFPLPNIHCWPGESLLSRKLCGFLRLAGVSCDLMYATKIASCVGAQVLHSHFGNRGWEMLPVAQRAGLKHVVSFYGYDLTKLPNRKPVWRDRYLQLFEEGDLFLCEGPHMADVLAGLGCPRKKILVQRLGVDLFNLPFRKPQRAQGDPLRILIAGRFSEKKGFKYALEAIGELLRKGRDIHVSIIGDATPHSNTIDEKKVILSTIEKYGMSSRVKLLGFKPHSYLIQSFCEHDVLLSPSVSAADGDSEGGAPVTIIEAVAAGLPVVSTYHCDIPYVVGGNDGAFLAPERSVDVLCQKLDDLYKYPHLGREKSISARRHVEKNYDLVEQSVLLAEKYRSLVSTSR